MTVVGRLLAIALLSQLFTCAVADEQDVRSGARIYLERCALCHGSKGLGEGPMALLIRDYPDTSLKNEVAPNRSIQKIVESGLISQPSGVSSPPWQHELVAAEISAVSAFVDVIRTDFEQAQRELASANVAPDRIDGRKIYRARCESCHGTTGQGDGRMSRVIVNPPPSDLTRSVLSHEETIEIISAGGAKLGRSPRMPPWGQELVYAELISVATYLATLRAAEAD